MKRHTDNRKRSTGDQSFRCNVCYQAFFHRSALSMHHLMHANEFPYSCETCSKLFAKKQAVITHNRTHLSVAERPYKCDVCGKKFSQKGALNGHKRIHTGERPYSCDICDKRFALKSYVDAHMNTHLSIEERPFECDVCYQKFTQKGALNIHLRRHTGERPYSCEMCDEKFAAKSYLTYHIKVRHMFEKSSINEEPKLSRAIEFKEAQGKNYDEQPVTCFKPETVAAFKQELISAHSAFALGNASKVMIHTKKALANESNIPLSRVQDNVNDEWAYFRM